MVRKAVQVTRATSPHTPCPYCLGETAIDRGCPGGSLGVLHPHEFEILVRNEWRRRLGSGAYGRAHDVRIVRTLVAIAAGSGPGSGGGRLSVDVDRLVTDLAAEGIEPEGVRREVHQLLRSCRVVLERADAGEASVRTFMARALRAVRYVLGYPRAA